MIRVGGGNTVLGEYGCSLGFLARKGSEGDFNDSRALPVDGDIAACLVSVTCG